MIAKLCEILVFEFSNLPNRLIIIKGNTSCRNAYSDS